MQKLFIRDCLFSLLSSYLCFFLLLHQLSANDLASYFNEKMEAFRREFPEITITTLGILSLLVPTYYTFLWLLVIFSMFLYKINSSASMLHNFLTFLFRGICPAILSSLFNISNYFSFFHIIVITIKICYYFFHVKSFLCPWDLLSFSLLTITPYFCSLLEKNFSFIYSCIVYFLSLLFFLNSLQSGICLSHCTETAFIKGIYVSHCEIHGSMFKLRLTWLAKYSGYLSVFMESDLFPTHDTIGHFLLLYIIFLNLVFKLLHSLSFPSTSMIAFSQFHFLVPPLLLP